MPWSEARCETCRVELQEENKAAARIYQMTRGQIIALGEHVWDINQQALWAAIDRYQVKDPLECFERVNRVFHHFLAKQREESGQ